jgi:hypothetical protein
MINKTDQIVQGKKKIDKLAKGIILSLEDNKSLNEIRAEYLTATDLIAREQSKVNMEFDVKYHQCAIDFINKEVEWWQERKKKNADTKTEKGSGESSS